MKKRYIIEGLDCPNCAEKIRSNAEKLKGVVKADMSFAKKQLVLEGNFDDSFDESLEKLVKRIEPESELVKEGSEKKPTNEKGFKADIIKIAAAAVLFAAGFILEKVLSPEASVNAEFIVCLSLFILAYLISGFEVIVTAIKNIAHGEIFDENFLMLVASLGALIIGSYEEAVAVMLFYQIGELFQGIAVNRSRRSISELMDIRPDYANVKRGGKTERVSPESVQIGDTIVVKAGEKIPLDGIVTDGSSSLNVCALTGESEPRDVTVGAEVLSGSINMSGLLEIAVSKSFGDSTVSKILKLVESADEKKAKAESLITKFAKIYTPVVVLLALLVALIPILFFGGEVFDWIKRGLIFLVISCPCALVISVPLSYFAGIGRASANGILVKGGNCFEALGKAKTVVFDKTGTLTRGVFKVTEIHTEAMSKESLLKLAAYAEYRSTHPIAKSICEAYGEKIDESRISGYTEAAGKGISVKVGAAAVLAGNERLMEDSGITVPKIEGTHVFIAVDGKLAGYLIISDEIKISSRAAIEKLKQRGIKKTVMLTGDSEKKAKAVAKAVGVDEVYYELLPQDKSEKLDELEDGLADGETLVYVGDGINDSPVLARADIGVAMGGVGSDSAIEAADIVLMNDDPLQLVGALEIAAKTRRVVIENVVFALSVKLIIQVLGTLGIANMWAAVVADVGVSLIAIINAMRLLKK